MEKLQPPHFSSWNISNYWTLLWEKEESPAHRVRIRQLTICHNLINWRYKPMGSCQCEVVFSMFLSHSLSKIQHLKPSVWFGEIHQLLCFYFWNNIGDLFNRAFQQCNFSLEFPETLSQNHICYHWLSVSGISKIMHRGILIIMPYWKEILWVSHEALILQLRIC